MNNKKTIFISAYRNVSIRYFLYTDILGQLRKDKNIRIVVFVKDNDVDYYQHNLGSDNIIFVPVYYTLSKKILRSGIENFIYLIRMSLYPYKRGMKNNTGKIVWRSQTRVRKAGLYGTIYQFIIRDFLSLPITFLAERFYLLRRVIVSLESHLFPGKLYDNYFNEYKPSLLIVSSLGHMIDSYIMRAAKRNQCKVLTLFHNWDNATTKGYKGVHPDHVIVWNESMKNEVKIFHDISEEIITIFGAAHWDLYFNGKLKPKTREEFCEEYGLLKDHKIILFGVAHWSLWPGSLDIIDGLMKQIVKDRFITPVQLLVRLHPGWLHLSKNRKKAQVIDNFDKWLLEIKDQYGKLIHFKHPNVNVLNDDVDLPLSDLKTLAELIMNSDLLLTQYSTLLVEGPILDIPTINVGLDEFRHTGAKASFYENCYHINEIMKYEAFKSAYTYDELVHCINYYLKNPTNEKQQRRKLVNNMMPMNRGHAGEDIGNFLKSLVY